MRWLLVSASLLFATSCLDHQLPPEDSGAPTSFIALQRDFENYQGWMQYDLGETFIEGHPAGHRVMAVNKLPAPGANTFPVGTIIMKTMQVGEQKDWILHAMTKRGGEYNTRGAQGWEWFELQLSSTGIPVIIWRGEAPPNGERYGCLTGTCDENAPDCNQCHLGAAGNDFVMTDALHVGE